MSAVSFLRALDDAQLFICYRYAAAVLPVMLISSYYPELKAIEIVSAVIMCLILVYGVVRFIMLLMQKADVKESSKFGVITSQLLALPYAIFLATIAIPGIDRTMGYCIALFFAVISAFNWNKKSQK